MKTSRFTSHIYPSSAGSCLISIWLGATHPAAPLWPRKLETSTFGKNIPTFRASPRSFLQVSGIHLKPDFWEVCINSTRFSTEEKRAIYFVLKYKWQMILVLMGKKKGLMKTLWNSRLIFKSNMWEGRTHRKDTLQPDWLGSSSVEKDLEMWADTSAGHDWVSRMPWHQELLSVPWLC